MRLSAVMLAAAIPALLSGCVKVDARAPESISFGGENVFSSAPPAQIPVAPADDGTSLQRENRQLRQRIGWLTEQNRKADEKHRDLAKDMEEIRLEMQKIAAQRDRYLRALGQ